MKKIFFLFVFFSYVYMYSPITPTTFSSVFEGCSIAYADDDDDDKFDINDDDDDDDDDDD